MKQFVSAHPSHQRMTGIKRTMVIFPFMALLFSFIQFPVFADEANKLETMYHVYIDGEYAGKVDDAEVVEKVIERKIAEAQNDFADLSLTVEENITYVSEKTFEPTYENEQVASLLEEKLTIAANAAALIVNDQHVGYFKDEQTIERLLEKYQEKYVDKNILKKVQSEKRDKRNMSWKPAEIRNLEIGETAVIDVDFTEQVRMTKKKADPKEVLTIDQGISLLEKGSLTEKIHTVEEGEVLGEIAAKYDLSMEKLLDLNPSLTEDSLLQIGQEINVTDYEPFVEVVVKEQSLKEEKIPYETEIIESDELYKGEQKVKQKGKHGKKEVQYLIETVNGKTAGKEVLQEEITKEPVKEIVIKGTKVIPSRGTGELHWPTVGGYISSHVGYRWGSMHKGIDIARPANRNILAADNGVVEFAGYDNGGYGNKIIINHNNEMKTVYAHLSSISVSVGQTVEKGKVIGIMGSTGNSTGIHLHFELYKNGALQNPLDYL